MDARIPTVSGFYEDGQPYLVPGSFVDRYCQGEGLTREQIGIRPGVVLTFFPELTRVLAQQAGAEKAPFELLGSSDRPLYTVDDQVCLATASIGAPGTVLAVEEMIACGARDFIVLGAAGSLQPDLPIGSVVLPETAIREEGTSHHYEPPDVPARATPEALEALREAWKGNGEPRAGLHWTTDAPYREHVAKIDTYRDAGVLSVDMEVSAMYVLAKHRSIRCAAILAISDEVFEPYRIGYTEPDFMASMLQCGLAAVEAAKALAGSPAA
jgi:purine-nucleoside phosphorylase